jgi:hypothetical protein
MEIKTIEVKGIKHFPSLSEETNCFSATIYVNGKKCAIAENRGNGGCTDYYPLEGCKDILRGAEDFCKGLPPIVYSFGTIDNSLECFIDDEVENWIQAQENKKLQKKFARMSKDSVIIGNDNGYVQIKFGTDIETLKAKEPKFLYDTIAQKLEKYKAQEYRVLNTNI